MQNEQVGVAALTLQANEVDDAARARMALAWQHLSDADLAVLDAAWDQAHAADQPDGQAQAAAVWNQIAERLGVHPGSPDWIDVQIALAYAMLAERVRGQVPDEVVTRLRSIWEIGNVQVAALQ